MCASTVPVFIKYQQACISLGVSLLATHGGLCSHTLPSTILRAVVGTQASVIVCMSTQAPWQLTCAVNS